MSDDSLTELSESVQFERELVESQYSSKNFEPDPENSFKYALTLLPQNEPYYVSVKLHFDTSPPYPRKPLKCFVEGIMGLSGHQLNELQKEVDQCANKAQKSTDVAVNHVTDTVKQYLFDNNKKRCSLHDDMERNNRNKMEFRGSNLISIQGGNFEKRYPPCIQPGSKVQIYKDPLNPENSSSLNVTCLAEVTESGTFHAIDENFKLHLLQEFILDLSSMKLKTELLGIQKEFSRNSKLRSHAHVMNYVGLACNPTNISNVVHVLTTYALPLSGYEIGPYGNSKKLARDMVSGLQYLHRQDIFHGLLSIDSVYVSPNGQHLIADYGFAKRLLSNSVNAPMKFSFRYLDAVDESGRFLDVLLLGHLLYHVLVGRKPDLAYPSPPSHLDPSLLDLIKLCVTKEKSQRITLNGLAGTFDDDSAEGQILQVAQKLDPPKRLSDSMEQPWKSSNRITDEFDLKEELGVGGFGSVFKVRNKMDGNFYAMKVVELTRVSENSIRSMLKEVKLLSKLKHNNIVRYNYSFFDPREPSLEDDQDEPDTDTVFQNCKKSFSDCNIDESGDSSGCQIVFDSGSESTEPGASRVRDCEKINSESGSSSGIEIAFERSKDLNESKELKNSNNTGGDSEFTSSNCAYTDSNTFESSTEPSLPSRSSPEITRNRQTEISSQASSSILHMFIVMELCENATLRTMIDNKKVDPPLHKDPDLVLRLLRQIIDALEYIESSGVIHRDLKPENIFLDADNNVKIGDFGLAISENSRSSKKGAAGTSIYLAPEIRPPEHGKFRPKYSHLSDIYSLGIICFEMVHEPFGSNSERYTVIGELRKSHVGIDDGVFNGEKFSKLEVLVRNMLSHDLTVRKKASELSKSDILPPRLVEQGLNELLRHLKCEHGSQLWNQFLNCLFSDDIANRRLSQLQLRENPSNEDLHVMQALNNLVVQMIPIFDKHSAFLCPLPFFLPKCDITDQYDRSFVILSNFGHYQVLPFNFKVNLAKYILENNIRSLKSYSFNPIFQKMKDEANLTGRDQIPSHLNILEASFDIISSESHFATKAEVLIVLLDVLKTVPEFRTSNVSIYVNHIKIMKAILMFFKIDDVFHNEIFKLLHEFDHNESKLDEALNKCFQQCSMDDSQISKMCAVLKCKCPIDLVHKQMDICMILHKSARQVGDLFKEGLKEIIQVLLLVTSPGTGETECIFDPESKFNELAEKLSKSINSDKSALLKMVKFRAGISSDPDYYSDFMFKVVAESSDCKSVFTIAEGGDFSKLLEHWQSAIDPEFNDSSEELLPSTVFGISFFLENMVKTIMSPYNLLKTNILIVSAAEKENSVKIFSFMKSLWQKGLKPELSVTADRSALNAVHVVNFAPDGISIDSDKAYLQSLGIKDGKQSKGLTIDEALNYLVDIEYKLSQVAGVHSIHRQRSAFL